jgi:hypothetical protein
VPGKIDHETMRIDMVRAAARVRPPVTINDLELEAQESSVMKIASGTLANLASACFLLRVAWRCHGGLLF